MSQKRSSIEAKTKKANRGREPNRKGQRSSKLPKASQNRSGSDRKASGGHRKFKLSTKQLEALRTLAGKKIANPYREGSSYYAVVAALDKLGVGRLHAWDRIFPAVISAMGAGASGFKSQEKRSDATGKGWKDRVRQNVQVVGRADYGAKLRQVGYEVRTKRANGAGLFKL